MSYIYLSQLKEHRERRGLTQEELATLSGVSRPTIAALELGYRKAYPRTVKKLAKALKVKPETLKAPGDVAGSAPDRRPR
jgi:transcriptional regulator with XRE-family HTH domain